LLKNLTKLLVSLSLVSNLSYADTTGNLVSQDFTTEWTNTGNSYHGSNTIAGHHNGTVESDSVSLNAEGINKESLNGGFSITGSANVWFWNNETQSVTQTIKTVDDNGQTITQNRTLSGTCATWNGCNFGSMTDTLIINSNTQQDYDVNLKYTFSVPNQTSGHYGADLKDPSLTVNYTYVPPLDNATQTALLDLNNDIKDDLKDIDKFTFVEEDFKFEDDFKFEEEPMTLDMQTESFQEDKVEMTFEDTFKDTESFDNKEEPKLKELQSEILEDQDSASDQSTMVEEEMSIETNKEEKETSQQTKESKEDNEQKKDSSENQQVSQQSNSESKKIVSLEKTMEKIDAKVKDIGTNLGLKNIVKLKAMVDNDTLSEYVNKTFYQEKKIYENQADIRDNRVLYADSSLVSYTQNDPIFTKEKELFTIKMEKEKLQKEIEVLKNGF
jgi:hypothetical protein